VFDDLPACSRTQHGVFTREQAYDAGWTPRQVRRRLAAGRWQVVAGAALGRAGPNPGIWQLAQAVGLTWPDAVVSHELAAALWGFPLPAPTIATATLTTDRKVHRRGLVAVRRRLPAGQVVRIRGLKVTDQTRTAVDLLAAWQWDAARNLFAWLSTRNQLSVRELGIWAEHRAGMTGTAQLRRLVRVSAGGSLSAAEDRLHHLLRAASITGWQPNARILVGGRVVAIADVLFERQRVVVEVDGWSSHSSSGG
jgi:very-short-patch-repair endonuclease